MTEEEHMDLVKEWGESMVTSQIREAHEQLQRLRDALDTMLAWHDRVLQLVGPVPSPYNIEDIRTLVREGQNEHTT